jgi:hypothetical protein
VRGWGDLDRVLSREGHAAAATWEGSLADGDLPITVAGPRPVCTALPRFPSLQIVDLVYGGPTKLSMNGSGFRRGLAIFPVGLALFDERAKTFLGIFQAIKFVQKNIHGIFQAIAKRKANSPKDGFFGHGEDGP